MEWRRALESYSSQRFPHIFQSNNVLLYLREEYRRTVQYTIKLRFGKDSENRYRRCFLATICSSLWIQEWLLPYLRTGDVLPPDRVQTLLILYVLIVADELRNILWLRDRWWWISSQGLGRVKGIQILIWGGWLGDSWKSWPDERRMGGSLNLSKQVRIE